MSSGAEKKSRKPSALGVGRREAAAILGLSQRGVMYLEQQGDLVGIRDASGRVRFKLKDVRDLHRARREKHEPVAILDVGDEGELILKDDGQYDLAERAEALRFERQHELEERRLALYEREVLAKESMARVLTKHLPKAASALERMSWSSIGGTAIQALPAEMRQTLITEFALLIQSATSGGVSPDESMPSSETKQ